MSLLQESNKPCPVCGWQPEFPVTQCRHCGTLYEKPKSFLSKLRIFKRLDDLELENKRLKAAIMKLHTRSKRRVVEPTDTQLDDVEEVIEHILKME